MGTVKLARPCRPCPACVNRSGRVVGWDDDTRSRRLPATGDRLIGFALLFM
jgi:hypothetical protein